MICVLIVARGKYATRGINYTKKAKTVAKKILLNVKKEKNINLKMEMFI